jgi:CRISPR/Cas system-associated exonuclease Cas4 (RecB family)
VPHTPYTLNGEEIPSVTEIIGIIDKPFLRMWYGKNGIRECERIKKESGELGSRVHDAIEAYLRGDIPAVNSHQETEMLQHFVRWREFSDFRPVELELKVVSERYRFHGTFDALGTFGDSTELVMCDWKTSSKIDDTYALQLSAYAAAYEERTGIAVKEGLIVRMDKKEDARKLIEVKQFKNLPRYFEIFLSCLDLWNFVHKRGKWEKAA